MTFEEAYPRISEIIERRRSSWTLSKVKFIDFDDIKSEIIIHTYNKWHLYDQNRVLEAWVNQVARNQIINKLQKHYGQFVKPCMGCAFNEGDNLCRRTPSKTQCGECNWYAKWESKKRSAFEIHFAQELDSTDATGVAIYNPEYDLSRELDFDSIIESIRKKVESEMNPTAHKLFVYLYVDKISEQQAAEKLGYKKPKSGDMSEAGKRQIFSYKKRYRQIAKDLFEIEDVFRL